MNIKKRLGISYIAMMIIPFIIVSISGILYLSYFEGNIQNKYGIKFLPNKADLLKKILQSDNSLSRKVNNQILQNADMFLNKTFAEDVEKNIDLDYSGIVIRKSQNVIYSSENIKNDLNKIRLPNFGAASYNISQITKLDSNVNRVIIISQQDFYFKDGSQGSIFHILNMSTINSYMRNSAYIMMIYVFIIIALTNGILSYLVSKSIIKPLGILDHAANEIRQGNLDYEIKIHSKDEIGEVCDSFEEMRMRLKESLQLQQRYEENRKELISNISHDLKTPITSIKGYVEGIRDGVADTPDKMSRYINTIYTKAKYMDNLIDDLFLFSKLDLNRIPFDFQNVDIGNFIKEYIEEISFDLDKNSIDLMLNVPKEPVIVKADVQKIKRVIMNIIENSIKYRGKEKLRINIDVYDKEDSALIKISDNGKGISKEALPYIFDRFYRADAFRGTNTGGSGLGLAIVRRIIDEHKGHIWAESELNKGTAIFFTLDKQQEEVTEHE